MNGNFFFTVTLWSGKENGKTQNRNHYL